MAETRQKFTDVHFKAGEQSASDPMKFVMSTNDVDRQGDVVEQNWNLAEFRKNPVALWAHNHSQVIGNWTDVKVEDGKLTGRLKMAAKGTSQLVDEIRSLLEQRILRAVSVGFSAEKSEPLGSDENSMWGATRFLKNTLLECSVCSVPANQNALMTRAKSLGISNETIDLAFGKGVPAQTPRKVTKGVTAPQPNANLKGQTMSLADRIKQQDAALDQMRGSVNDLVEGAAGRDFTDEEQVQIEALSGEIEATDKNLNTLKRAEHSMTVKAAQAAQAVTVPAHQRSAPVAARAVDPNEKPGSLLVKAAVVKALAHAQKRSEADVLAERYGHDQRKDAINMIMHTKSDANTAVTSQPGWASELVTNDTRGWISELEAVSVFGRLSALGTGIDFGGSNSVTVPGRDRSKRVAGSWVGENATIPVKDGLFSSIVLNRFKKSVISVYSEELMMTSNPNIEAVLRNAMRMDTADSLDADLLDGSAGVAGIRPPSLLNGQPTQAGSATGTLLDDVHADLKYLIGIHAAQNSGLNPLFIMNPAQALGLSLLTNATGAYVFTEIENGTLKGIPVVQSTNVPAGTVILADGESFASAAGTPEYRVSDQATLVMLDDDGVAPTMADTNAVSVAGSVKVSDAAGVVGGPAKVKSMFQQYSTALRQIYPVSWSATRPNTAPYITGANW